MTKLFWPAVIGVVISVISERGYVLLAPSTTTDAKYTAVVFYVVATVGLFWRASRSHGLASLLGLAVVIAIGSVVAFQAFDFWRSGSVLKGMTPFSWDHLSYTMSFSLPVIGAWYGLVAVVAYAGRRVVRAMNAQAA